ncbi:DUF5107 domain-containing protein [Mucilaginibacter sp. L3T2-6]|uniref:DUF5107 domain-containing protein n=1 Tax=Mucilaginibacter sp. L3T2-6 TaxID=3062491 RepID=UPI002676F544|nr:DUF5107 domain-containing protein [Mucilaginibacter sp. L3T2-6]MDO3644728.1 DUF5107 domain-containing protein [Mucilaginibacter sp. L3T2-6]MDV6217236.1 DUF5107 domain-containing protein [Mucilaginibacter sp. L3T2-6]
MKRSGLKYYAVFLMAWLPLLTHAQNDATIKEYLKTYTTYPFSQPNPVPNSGLIYPYFRFDGFTGNPVQQQWKVVELENDFIKVQIMPQIGGKIWTATDKKNNKPFIYNNDVVKFRDIAMRGPWTSGGIEANFGIIGHTPGVSNPVDYIARKNEDGSVSCVISLLDLLTQSRWSMEIRLPKDKAYFTTSVFWHNGSGEDMPYYSWMNLAEKVSDDLQFIEPGTRHIFHDGKAYNWPIDAEHKRNLSHYGELDFGRSQSFHVTGTYSKYWGAFWKNENYGMMHYAEREDKVGKKVFVWGRSREGMIWDKLLNDNAGQYAELQSGRLYIQNVPESVYTPYKQTSFMPYQTDTWKEYWYPFSQTDGVAIADTTGVINVKQDGQQLKIYFSPVDYVKDTLKVADRLGEIIYSKALKLDPLQGFEQTVDLKSGETPSQISIGDLVCKVKDSAEKVLSRPATPVEKADYASAYGLYLKGHYFTGTRHYPEAEECIKASLAKEPAFIPALSEMALIQYKKMNYQAAFDYAQKALSIDTYDGKANYYYGLAALKLDKIYDAEDGFELAALTTDYRSAAFTELARIRMMQQKYTEAGKYAVKALEYNAQNTTALQLQYLSARLCGQSKLQKQTGERILALDPLNHFIRFEKYWQHRNKESVEQFTALIRDELPEQTYLDLAVWYHALNRNQESVAILQLAPAKNNELAYWLAYLHRYDKSVVQWLNDAVNGSADMVFPYKAESTTIMQWAAAQNKHDWKPRYYLSLLYEAAHDRAKARHEIEGINGDIDFAPFYAYRARLHDSTRHDLQLSDLKKAATIDTRDWHYVKNLADFYLVQKQYKEALSTVSPWFVAHPENYIMGMLYARCQMLNGEYKTAESVLDTLRVLPYEGSRDGHKLYEQTKLMLALELIKAKKTGEAERKVKEARGWPEHLGVGAPYPNLVDDKLEDDMDSVIRLLKQQKQVHAKQLNALEARIKHISQ